MPLETATVKESSSAESETREIATESSTQTKQAPLRGRERFSNFCPALRIQR